MMKNNNEENPFLCNKCQPYGYCLKAVNREKAETKKQNFLIGKLKSNEPVTDRQISQWVPVRTVNKDTGTGFGKKLQQAHELFHQDEFEQASYMYRDMLETRNDCDEILIGLSACFYFMQKYEDAAATAERLNNVINNRFPIRFISQCEKKIREMYVNKTEDISVTKDDVVSEKTKSIV